MTRDAREELVYEPLFEQDGLRVSRSPWGSRDEIGRLNWMTPESRAAVVARLDGSRVFDLAVEYFPGMPSWVEADDPKYDIWMTHTPQGTVNEQRSSDARDVFEKYAYAGSAVTMYTHVGTSICSLNHIGHHGRFWNGWTAAAQLGSRAWSVGGSSPAIVARGVLLDVASLKGLDCLVDSYAITAQDLVDAANDAGVEMGRGDVVLVRTGRMSRWPDWQGFMSRPPGLGLEAARYLCERVGAMCVGADCGGEALPPEQSGTFLPVHAYLLATAGTPIIENLWLEDLARADVHEFGLLAFPLKLVGSTGCPVRPVAIPFRS